MYLQVPSGLMSVLYDGFAKDIHTNSHWKRAGNNDWMFLYRFGEYTYSMHTRFVEDKMTCRLKIAKDTWKVEFNVVEMEKIMKIDENKDLSYIEMLTITAREQNSDEVGTFFFIAYELEEKVFNLNKVRRK